MISSCNSKVVSDTSDKTWWKETVFYEVYMPSFKDSDGDGYSDFKGLSSKLDYIEKTNWMFTSAFDTHFLLK